MAIDVTPITAAFAAAGGQGTITLTDTASSSWHDTPRSGDNWAALREKDSGSWSPWFVFGKNGVSGAYLPLAGGAMSGSIVMPAGSLTKEYGYKFGSGETVYGQFTANASGLVGIYAAGNIVLRPENNNTKGLVISTADVTFNGTSILGGSVSPATVDDYGTVKIAAKRTNNPTLTTGGTTSGRYYGVEMRSDGRLFVNVPWVSGSGGSTVAWGTVSNNTAPLTVDGTPHTVLLSGWTPDLSGYLPLTAGSSKPLTGTLSSRAIVPTTNSTTQSNGYELGSSSYYWRNLYTRRVYLSANVYIYYDSTNNCIRTNAPIASDSWISAGGVA